MTYYKPPWGLNNKALSISKFLQGLNPNINPLKGLIITHISYILYRSIKLRGEGVVNIIKKNLLRDEGLLLTPCKALNLLLVHDNRIMNKIEEAYGWE